MKDSYMIFVLLAVMITPFLPQLLKGKCPSCGKRKLEALDSAPDGAEETPFLSYHACKNCLTNFRREKSGPLQAMGARSEDCGKLETLTVDHDVICS